MHGDPRSADTSPLHLQRDRDRLAERRFGLTAGLIFGFGVTACADLSDVTASVCGNRVVEPGVSEECDTVATLSSGDAERPAACGAAGTDNACKYVWDATHACPTGWKQGQDQRCRQPSGTFGTPSATIAELRGHRPQVADHDGDGQLDVMVDTLDDVSTVPFYLARSDAGFSATAGIEAAAGAGLGDLTADGIADIATTVDLSNAFEPQSQMSGLVLRRGDQERSGELRIYPGPSTFPGDAIYAMVPRPPPETPVGAGEPAPDLHFAAAVYWDPQASCGGQICTLREYEAFPEPLELFAPNSPPDLALASAGSGRDHSFVGIQGQIGFIELAPDGTARSFSLPLGQVFAGGITVDDFNGDGEEDVVVVTRRAATKQWHFLLLAGPSFGDLPTTLVTVDALEAEGGPAFAFINGDSIPDVVISGASSLDVDVAWKSGGIFVAHSPFIEESSLFETHAAAAGPLLQGSSVIPDTRWTRHAVGDLNGDGRDDVAAAYLAGTTPGLEIVLGGDLVPLASVRTTTSLPVKQVAITDLDGDGLGDVVVAVGDPAVTSCDGVPDDILVAYGRAAGFPDPLASIGSFPGVAHFTPGRFERPSDGAGDIGVTSACIQSDGTTERRSTIIRGDTMRRPFAPFVLGKVSRSGPVFIREIAGRPTVFTAGYAGTLMLDVLEDGDIGRVEQLPELPTLGLSAQAVESAPGEAGAFVLAGLKNGWLRLESFAVEEGAPVLVTPDVTIVEVPTGSQRPPRWSLATVVSSGGLATLAVVARQDRADEDGDGIEDEADICPVNENPDQTDADEDGVGDACDDDDDDDGVTEGQGLDNCPATHNPDQADLDGDFVGDACDVDMDGDGLQNLTEVYAGTAYDSVDSDGDTIDDVAELGDPDSPADTDGDGTIDALDADSDDDGVPDVEEAGDASLGSRPVDADADGTPDFRDLDSDEDGAPDGPIGMAGRDNCRFVANPGQVDTDSDGIGDACETIPDTDGDSVPDAFDNCPSLANPAQLNHDADPDGDSCDDDDDDDGIVDGLDWCPWDAAASQNDADFDGKGDACDGDDDDDGYPDVLDNCPYAPNVGQEDDDGDGNGNICDFPGSPVTAVPYSTFALYAWEPTGELGASILVALPAGSGEFVGVIPIEGRDLDRVLYVATDTGVFRVGCTTGSLPTCKGGGVSLEPLAGPDGDAVALDVSGITGITSGDFNGDGLEDLMILGAEGGRVVPQLPL